MIIWYTNDDRKLQAKAEETCQQIRDMDYNEYFPGFRVGRIEQYGIAFSGKVCKVLKNV